MTVFISIVRICLMWAIFFQSKEGIKPKIIIAVHLILLSALCYFEGLHAHGGFV